jgi:hypothetical protein
MEQIVAERIIRQLFDDLDQTEIPDGKGGSVEFALRGTTYTIDLTDANIAKLDKAFAPFVKAAVPAKGSSVPVLNLVAPSPRRSALTGAESAAQTMSVRARRQPSEHGQRRTVTT